MEPILPKDRLLKMLVAQNAKICPFSDWKILKMYQPMDAWKEHYLCGKHRYPSKSCSWAPHKRRTTAKLLKKIIETKDRLKETTVSRGND